MELAKGSGDDSRGDLLQLLSEVYVVLFEHFLLIKEFLDRLEYVKVDYPNHL